MDKRIKASAYGENNEHDRCNAKCEAAESKPALKNACVTDFIFCQEKDYRCNDQQVLQSNRTVSGQDLSCWPLAALLWKSHMRYLLHTVDRHVICFWHTHWYNWDHLGPWKINGYFCEVQNAIIVRRTNGYGSRYQEPNLESTCLGHGHVKPC